MKQKNNNRRNKGILLRS